MAENGVGCQVSFECKRLQYIFQVFHPGLEMDVSKVEEDGLRGANDGDWICTDTQ